MRKYLAVLVGVILGGLMACQPVTIVTPDTKVVALAGYMETRELLKDTLLRAISPRTEEVIVDDDGIRYRLNYLVVQHLKFITVGNIELYENKTVLVRGVGGQVLNVFVMATMEDAQAFADITMTLRARYLRMRGLGSSA